MDTVSTHRQIECICIGFRSDSQHPFELTSYQIEDRPRSMFPRSVDFHTDESMEFLLVLNLNSSILIDRNSITRPFACVNTHSRQPTCMNHQLRLVSAVSLGYFAPRARRFHRYNISDVCVNEREKKVAMKLKLIATFVSPAFAIDQICRTSNFYLKMPMPPSSNYYLLTKRRTS